MIALAPCKINLGLHITSKRKDGYHELDTVFYPVGLHDAIEILPNHQASIEIEFTNSGLPIPGNEEQNLCIKAYHLLKKDFPDISPIRMHLHKNIPMGAGLGGGSSDGTTVLKMLNSLFKLDLTENQLSQYALQLGSDCPFFVRSTACHATGRGEIISPFTFSLSNFQLLLIHPGIHISTAWAFSQITPHQHPTSTLQLVQLPIEQWKDTLINDFEQSVLSAHPKLEALKSMLYQKGATYVSMSGSGSSFFALFPLTINVKALPIPSEFRVDFV